MNDKEQFTRLTLEQSDKKIVWEVPYEDVDGIDDMMQAIYTIMVGMTFNPVTVYRSMASFVNEYSDELEVVEKDKEKDSEENSD